MLISKLAYAQMHNLNLTLVQWRSHAPPKPPVQQPAQAEAVLASPPAETQGFFNTPASNGAAASAEPAREPAGEVRTGACTGRHANSQQGTLTLEAWQVLIELRNVHKSFGSKRVLRGSNITIRRGEAVGIIGGSGSGKSTTLRIMAGLMAPDWVRTGLAPAEPHMQAAGSWAAACSMELSQLCH